MFIIEVADLFLIQLIFGEGIVGTGDMCPNPVK